MSSILKALRKIGEEKRADQHAAPDLRLDQGLVPVKPKPFLPLLAGVALGAVTVGLLFLLLVPRGTSPVAKVQTVSQPEKAVLVEKKAVEPVVTETLSSKNNIADQSLKVFAESSKVPVVTLSPEPAIVAYNNKMPASKVAPKALVKKASPAPVPEVSGKTLNTTLKPPEVVVAETTSSEHSELPDGVTLIVAEIFYQEDNANSMAVVNDLPVMIGTRVDSAVVTEIRLDSVLFEIDDKMYVVALTNP